MPKRRGFYISIVSQRFAQRRGEVAGFGDPVLLVHLAQREDELGGQFEARADAVERPGRSSTTESIAPAQSGP